MVNMYYTVLILTLLHSERPKLYTILAFVSAIGLKFMLERWIDVYQLPLFS